MIARMRRAPWLAARAFLLAAALRSETVDRIAATVNDGAIAESEVRKAMVVSALSAEPGEDEASFRTRVLEALIDQRLEYEEALRFGPPPPDAAEVQEALQGLRQRLAKAGKDPKVEFARAGLTPEEVQAMLERQLVVRRYLRERFAPVAYADEQRAREEYEKRYVPERRAAGLSVAPFESVVEEMRHRSQERVFESEVERWMRELREKARVAIYRIPPPLEEGRQPVVLSNASPSQPAAPRPTPTPTP
jgi:parvulin-like peptidyl-prolyl isomerase